MKQLLPVTGLFILLAGCSQTFDISDQIPGAYYMSEQTIKQGDDARTFKDLNQLKIYTPSHFMYVQLNPQDESVSFGVGSYTIEGTKLKEHKFYTSSAGVVDTQPSDFDLDIRMIPEAYNQAAGYSQTISDIIIGNKSSTLIEFYRKSKDSIQTPLDGLWKETQSFLITNGDTSKNNRTQYKAFYNGNFMFGNTVKTDTDSTFTGMGYGTFKITGPNQLEETDLNSSYAFIAGNSFPLKYEITDNDHYVQTVSNVDGSIGVEYYERVK